MTVIELHNLHSWCYFIRPITAHPYYLIFSATTEELVNNTRLVAQVLSSTDLQTKKKFVVMQSMSNFVKSLQDKLEDCSQSMTVQPPTKDQPLLTNPPGEVLIHFQKKSGPYLGMFICGGKLRTFVQGSPVYRQIF